MPFAITEGDTLFRKQIQLISNSNDYFTPACSKFSPFHNGKFVFKGQLPTLTVRE